MRDPAPPNPADPAASLPNPMTVNKYKLVAASIVEIEEQVNRLIEAGWQPFGAPFFLPSKPDDLTLQQNMVYQAMVLSTTDRGVNP
jgi:hypothetical protein